MELLPLCYLNENMKISLIEIQDCLKEVVSIGFFSIRIQFSSFRGKWFFLDPEAPAFALSHIP